MADHSDLGFQPANPHDDLGFVPTPPKHVPGAGERFISAATQPFEAAARMVTDERQFRPATFDNIAQDVMAIPKDVYGKVKQGDYAGAAGEVVGNVGLGAVLHGAGRVLPAGDVAAATNRAAVMERMGVPDAAPAAAAPAAGGGMGILDAVRLVRKLRNLTPGKVVDRAIDAALDHVEEISKPKAPAPPAPPPEALAVPAAPADPILEHIARAKANVQAQAAPARAVPRPPEYYGVQTPPAQVAPLPTQAPPVAPEAAASPAGRVAEIDATLKHFSETAPGSSPSYSAAIDSLLRERDSLAAAAPAEVATQPTAAPAAAEAPATVAKQPTPGVKDANTLAAKFGDWGFSPSEAAGMNDAGWAKLAHDAGVKFPSAAVRDRAIRQLRSNLAGPEVPVTELIDKLRKSFSAKQ